MLRRRLYYAIKPYMPWGIRMAVRRIFARRKREQCKDIWPIDHSTSRPPDGWTGWPEGKKFAFVLTHDVEGAEGVAKCRQLAELEMKFGFRSSFNFIPDGTYKVPAELRTWLTENGFEVGVHDLHHDGKLFQSRQGFLEKAAKINHYLHEWKASGYRSGFMLRNLDWYHDLDIEYDASTFDTDPFEPQPDGAGTIFPYWIPSPGDGIAKSKAASAKCQSPPLPSPSLSPSPLPPSPASLASVSSTVHRPPSTEQPSTGHRPPSTFASVSQSENCGQTPGGQQATTASLPPPASLASVSSTVHHPPSTGSRQGLPSEASAKEGYIELPYTLPQDSTLFLLLREKSPEIWLNKLDWVAAHDGMALVNVHPDYLRFDGEPASPSTFPVDHYVRLLQHMVSRYGSTAWLANPHEIATHVRKMSRPPVNRRSLRICMVTHSHYASDTRVIRYAEALAARGDCVDVIGLRPKPTSRSEETRNGVRIHRLQDRFYKSQNQPLDFLLPILQFFSRSAWWILRQPQRFDLFHIHNIPDFLVFVALYPRFRGAKVILDIHDLVPEFYESKFGRTKRSLTMRLLKLIERVSARFADHIIIANHLWLERYQTRTHAAGKCSVYINNVDETTFCPRRRVRTDDRRIIIFPGGLHWHQGLDVAIRAFPQILAQVPGAEFHIYGDGSQKNELLALVETLKLKEKVLFFPLMSAAEIATVMAEADVGLVPKRADSFGNEAYSTKIMEFMSLGIPVVASETKIDRYYFNDSVLSFFRSGDETDLASKVVAVLTKPDSTTRLVAAAAKFAKDNCWGRYKQDYLALVDSMIPRAK